MKWLDDFQLAVIEGDVKLLSKLIKDVPSFESLEDMQTASALIEEAKKIIESKKGDLLDKMDKIKKTKTYLNTNV